MGTSRINFVFFGDIFQKFLSDLLPALTRATYLRGGVHHKYKIHLNNDHLRPEYNDVSTEHPRQ
jgi:hypothetical protein